MMMHILCEGDKPLPHSLAVHNTYTEMMTGSKSIAVVVRNLTATPITLKKNAPLARVVATNAIPNMQLLLGMVEQLDTAHEILTGRPKMTVIQWREALFEQSDLSSLVSWTPKSRVAACSLVA